MIQDVTNSSSGVYAKQVTTAYTKPTPSATPPARDPAVTVEISETARTVSSLLEGIESFNLDPEFHLKNAEGQLKTLLSKFGISSSEDVLIETKGDGSYTLKGEHPLLTEVEKLINSDDKSARDLRNSLAGAYNGSVLQHIGKATEMAMAGADANPSKTDAYYNWIVTVSKSTKGMGFAMTLENGALSGSLVDRQGKAFAAGEGLTLPA